MFAQDGKLGPSIIYNDLTMDDLFDKSSYANTLIGEHSVYSDKTLFSKLTVRNSNSVKMINKRNNIDNQINENESVQQLYPKAKNSDYVSLNIK